MKGKRNLILLIVLIVLAAIILIVERPFDDKTIQNKSDALLFFPDLDPSMITRIQVSKTNDHLVTISRAEQNWTVAYKNKRYPADEHMIAEAIQLLQALRKTDLTSRNKDKLGLFELRDHEALVVEFSSDAEQPLARLLIGKAGPDFFSTYIRKDGAEEVYLSDAPLKTLFERPPAMWRDRTLLAFNPEKATELAITTKEKRIVMGKDTQGNWHLQEPISGLADTETINTLLTGLSALNATNYADDMPLEESGIGDPQIHITVTSKDSAAHQLLIGNQQDDGKNYYATNGDRKYLFTLHQSIVEHLTPAVKDLEKRKMDGEGSRSQETEVSSQ